MSGELDAVIHAPNRLRICAMLAAVDEADFATLREALAVSDSVLSKQIRILEEAGYVAIRKASFAARQRTSLALTPGGRRAFAAHVAELERLVNPAKRGAGARSL
jgi:DNA-binding MarR family transcriptional regulator